MLTRFALVTATAAAVGLVASFVPSAAQQPARPSFDISSSLESRIGGEVPAMTQRSYADTGRGMLTAYIPTTEDKRKVAAALEALTPLQRKIAQERLRSITFADGLSSNAQTTRATGISGLYPEFEIVLNPIVLKETVSEFLTRKERQLFDSSGSSLSVSIDGGSKDAVVYVLLHEATHMADMLDALTPQSFISGPIPKESHTPFTRDVWEGIRTLAPQYRNPLLENLAWLSSGKKIPITQAQAFYEALGRTPLASAYGSVGIHDDLCELVAWRQMTGKLKQPYRIEIRDGERQIYSYEPMSNPLVQSRFRLLERFDSTGL